MSFNHDRYDSTEDFAHDLMKHAESLKAQRAAALGGVPHFEAVDAILDVAPLQEIGT